MFGHPSQDAHMRAGVAAAFKSAKTPAHLKPHLQARMNNMQPMNDPEDMSDPGGMEDMKEDPTMAMNINPAHRGLFTAKAKAAGKGVQQYANQKANAGGVLGKEANFARMAKRHFRPLGKKKKAKKSTSFDPFMGH